MPLMPFPEQDLNQANLLFLYYQAGYPAMLGKSLKAAYNGAVQCVLWQSDGTWGGPAAYTLPMTRAWRLPTGWSQENPLGNVAHMFTERERALCRTPEVPATRVVSYGANCAECCSFNPDWPVSGEKHGIVYICRSCRDYMASRGGVPDEVLRAVAEVMRR